MYSRIGSEFIRASNHADWVVDIGPEGGAEGGQLLFEGTPQQIINCTESYTGKYLKEYIERSK